MKTPAACLDSSKSSVPISLNCVLTALKSAGVEPHWMVPVKVNECPMSPLLNTTANRASDSVCPGSNWNTTELTDSVLMPVSPIIDI